MSRIPVHTVYEAQRAARPLRQSLARLSRAGQPLSLHARLARSPAVRTARLPVRRATAGYPQCGPDACADRPSL